MPLPPIIANAPDRSVALVESFLGAFQKQLTLDRFEKTSATLFKAGRYGILVGLMLAPVWGLVGAIKMESGLVFLGAMAYALVLAIGHWSAVEFDSALKRVLSSPSRVSSNAIMRTLSLMACLFIVVGILNAAGGSLTDTRGDVDEELIGMGVAMVVIGILMAWVWSHPEQMGIETDSRSSPGEDILAMAMLCPRTNVRLVPITFGLMGIGGALASLAGTWNILFEEQYEVYGMGGVMNTIGGHSLLVFAAFLPLITYFGYVFFALMVDLVASVLRIPSIGAPTSQAPAPTAPAPTAPSSSPPPSYGD